MPKKVHLKSVGRHLIKRIDNFILNLLGIVSIGNQASKKDDCLWTQKQPCSLISKYTFKWNIFTFHRKQSQLIQQKNIYLKVSTKSMVESVLLYDRYDSKNR